MKNEVIKYLISYSVFISSGSRLAVSAEINVPSSTLLCFEITMLKRREIPSQVTFLWKLRKT